MSDDDDMSERPNSRRNQCQGEVRGEELSGDGIARHEGSEREQESIAEIGNILSLLTSSDPSSVAEAQKRFGESSVAAELATLAEFHEAALAGLSTVLNAVELPDELDQITNYCEELRILSMGETKDTATELLVARYLKLVEEGDIEGVVFCESLVPSGHEIPEERVNTAVEKAYLKAYQEGDTDKVVPLTRLFQYTPNLDLDEVLQRESVLGEQKAQVLSLFATGSISKLYDLTSNNIVTLDSETLIDPEVQAALTDGVKTQLRLGNYENAAELIKQYDETRAVQSNEEVQAAAANTFLKAISTGDVEAATKLQERFSISENRLDEQNLAEAKSMGLQTILRKKSYEELKLLLSAYPPSSEILAAPDVRRAAFEGILGESLEAGNVQTATNIVEKLEIPISAFADPILKKTLQRGLIASINSGQRYRVEKFFELTGTNYRQLESEALDRAIDKQLARQLRLPTGQPSAWLEKLELPKERLSPLVSPAFFESLHIGDCDQARKVIEKHLSLDAPIVVPKFESANIVIMLENLELSTFNDALVFAEEYPDYIPFVYFGDNSPKLTKADLEPAKKLKLPIVDAEVARQAELELDKKYEEEEYQQLYEALNKGSQRWQGPDVTENFAAGAKTFGFGKMFDFINRSGAVTPQDALIGFSGVCKLQEASGMPAKRFYGEMVSQVLNDSTDYGGLSAVAECRRITREILEIGERDLSPKERIAFGIKGVADFHKEQDLKSPFETPADVLQSWNKLKKFSELLRTIGDPKLRADMAQLREEGPPELYNYVRKLAYHKASKVSTAAVMLFWRKPEEFLAAGASYTSPKAHSLKKPSNYFKVPYLDLSPTDMRDALVQGKLDRVQGLAPHHIRYTVYSRDNQVFHSLRDMAKVALGSRREGREGKAENTKTLFSKLAQELGSAKGLLDFLGGKSITPEEERTLSELVRNPEYGMKVKETVFVARLHEKSDPIAVIAGDDTACCMPFGDGKNTQYTFNLGTAQFTIQIERGDGDPRTVAQSVMTKDINVGVFAHTFGNFAYDPVDSSKHVGPGLLHDQKSTLAADNVEVAMNYQKKPYQQILETLYRDFFTDYVKRHGERLGLDTSQALIGVSGSDALQQLPTVSNTYIPRAQLSYSDNMRSTAYSLKLEGDTSGLTREKLVEVDEHRREERKIRTAGVDHLSFEDALAVAYLERHVYSDNTSLQVGLHSIQNGLMAKEISNSTKDRPNMSFKYTQKGELKGYLFAYEGKLKSNDMLNLGRSDEPVIYIADLAAKADSFMAGGKLVNAFVEQYRENYLNEGKMTPVFGQFREETSYRLLRRKLEKLSKELGIEFETEEVAQYHERDDKMRAIIIRPIPKSDEELAA